MEKAKETNGGFQRGSPGLELEREEDALGVQRGEAPSGFPGCFSLFSA